MPTPIPEVTEETNMQLTELMAQDGFEISYDHYEISNSIVNSSYFEVEAPKGYQYVITYFKIKNVTQEEKAFDASGTKITYMLDVDVSKRYRAALSVLENDMQYMEMTVPAQGEVTAVLVFEVKDTPAEQLHLILSDDADHSVFVKVK